MHVNFSAPAASTTAGPSCSRNAGSLPWWWCAMVPSATPSPSAPLACLSGPARAWGAANMYHRPRLVIGLSRDVCSMSMHHLVPTARVFFVMRNISLPHAVRVQAYPHSACDRLLAQTLTSLPTIPSSYPRCLPIYIPLRPFSSGPSLPSPFRLSSPLSRYLSLVRVRSSRSGVFIGDFLP